MRGTPTRPTRQPSRPGIIPAYAGNTMTCPCIATNSRDHPRVCGEHFSKQVRTVVYVGSSPRMRGTRVHEIGDIGFHGIIPAYAGNTGTSVSPSCGGRDHPRVCGEHAAAVPNISFVPGSSPRMRGIRLWPRIHHSRPGIIPAYAGNTCWLIPTNAMTGDHPRVCGEHIKQLVAGFSEQGSSPRMRGTHRQLPVHVTIRGIIPAYAGNTRRAVRSALPRGDHPRVCGEHNPTVQSATGSTGSSPRMRGTPAGRARPVNAPGIIPAYAGNTVLVFWCLSRFWDHPRVCGEHGQLDMAELVDQGSSPRMRGTRRTWVALCRWWGIIPAYAGNTHNGGNLTGRDWDHPRVCGEHRNSPLASASVEGSSPRMRGTLQRRPKRNLPSGIIPAYAGNTWVFWYPQSADWDHPRVCGEHICSGSYVITVPGSSPRMRGTHRIQG